MCDNRPGCSEDAELQMNQADGGDAGASAAADMAPEASDAGADAQTGFEILEIQSPTSIRAWISPQISRTAFDALQVPNGWRKNQPREAPECGADEVRFIRSPDGVEDGDIIIAEHFGYMWFHSATVVESSVPVDPEGVLTGLRVKKFHELVYNPGTCMVLLVSPEGEVYFRIGRDANRASDVPTLPQGWALMDYTPSERLVIQLIGRNRVIRTDNQDSFQGPVPQLEAAL